MNIIAITRPDFFSGETALAGRLFDCGLTRLHLRKPHSTEQQLAEWIEDISPEYRRRIVIHDHFELARRFGLGGIHLNSRNPLPPSDSDGLSISMSCHSIEEVRTRKDECGYLFLSPIYDSIFKEGYGSAFQREVLEKAASEGIIDEKVYALGGVSLEHIDELRALGFGGAAVLGALWQSDDQAAYLKALLKA